MTDQGPSIDSVARLPLFPKFSFDNQETDALVPSCRVENWQNFAEILNGKQDKLIDDMIYRGHRRRDWQLESTLARQFGGGAMSTHIITSLLDRFRLAMRGRGFDLTDKSENEIWAFGQHFGLATPLLDWTASPFVALFFAFLKSDVEHEIENPTRAVFRINRSLVAEVLPNLFFEPTLGENARLVNQAGLFTVTPEGGDNLVSAIINVLVDQLGVKPDDPNDVARYICKFHVPNEDRLACLNSLRRMNIHHANLFPDPMGASEYCNDWLSRAVLEQLKNDKEKKVIAERAKINSAPPKALKYTTSYDGELKDVVEILTSYTPNIDLNYDPVKLAHLLDDKYKETYTVDWPRHDSGSARVRLAFKRLLLAADFSEPSRENAVEALVKLYAARYWKAEKST